MELCFNNHDEVAYEGRTCPVCEMRDDKNAIIEERDSVIESHKGTIEELEGTIEELEQQILGYQSTLGEKDDELRRLYAGKKDGET